MLARKPKHSKRECPRRSPIQKITSPSSFSAIAMVSRPIQKLERMSYCGARRPLRAIRVEGLIEERNGLKIAESWARVGQAMI